MSVELIFGKNGCQHVQIRVTQGGETRTELIMRDELFGKADKELLFENEFTSVKKAAYDMAQGAIETPVLDEKSQTITMTKTPTHEQIKAALEGAVIAQDVAAAEVKR